MVGRIFLGRYEAIRLLGEGGMGRVYLARQLDLGRQVVIKVMHDHVAKDPLFCERFQRETLLMARFQHHYAVTLYDASLNDPQGPCIVMEYIRGITLDNLLQRNGRLSPTRVGRLLGQMCEVLQAAHSEGIIHRDLKPANLMVVDPDTPYEIIKVMDFGLAKLADAGANKGLATGAEFAVGTPGYMCPEQARGE
ncbi:MAG TPA: serine/threonine-protein kinase, partial [Gemmataceae bacterium]|nr:serine/threonine-protein kinase [Gemmataceae bacterium]